MKKGLPTQATLRLLFDYCPDTGVMTRRITTTNKTKPGDKVGMNKGNSYTAKVNYSEYKLHRLIWVWMTGEDPGEYVIDHKDRNPLNNKWSNLRKATSGQNNANKKNHGSYSKGVSLNKGKYGARLTFKGKEIYLGRFDTEKEAHFAYATAAREYHGEFACFG